MKQEENGSGPTGQSVGTGRQLHLVLTVAALVVAVTSAGLFLAVRNTTARAAVDKAVSDLELATRISEANSDLASGVADISPRNARITQREATIVLRELPNSVPDQGTGSLGRAAASSRKAAEQLRQLAGILVESENLRKTSTTNQAERLKRTGERLVTQSKSLAIGRFIEQSSNSIRAALKKAKVTLEGEDSLTEENRRDLAGINVGLVALAGSEGAIDDSVERVLGKQAASLDDRRDDLLSVTGPHDCGDNSDGNAVVINEGSMTCEEAIAITFRVSSGSEPAAGWICDITATTLENFTLDGASGRFCVNEGEGTRVSIYDRDAAAAAQAQESASPESRCGPGEDWVRTWGVPGSGRCIAIEGDETEG